MNVPKGKNDLQSANNKKGFTILCKLKYEFKWIKNIDLKNIDVKDLIEKLKNNELLKDKKF